MFRVLILLSAVFVLAETPKYDVIINGTKAKVWASSELKGKTPCQYSVKNLFDGDPKTAWVEGSAGNGVGEWVQIEFEKPVNVSTINISNGYQKSSQTLVENSKLQAFSLLIDDSLSPLYRDLQFTKGSLFTVGKILKSFKIYVDASTPGTKYKDLCITEFEIEANNPKTREGCLATYINNDFSYFVYQKTIDLRNINYHTNYQLNREALSGFVYDFKVEGSGLSLPPEYNSVELTIQYEYERNTFLHVINSKGETALFTLLRSIGDDGSYEYNVEINHTGDKIMLVFKSACNHNEDSRCAERIEFLEKNNLFVRY